MSKQVKTKKVVKSVPESGAASLSEPALQEGRIFDAFLPRPAVAPALMAPPRPVVVPVPPSVVAPEGAPLAPEPPAATPNPVAAPEKAPEKAKARAVMAQCSLENVMFSRTGGVFVVGWVDDVASALTQVTIKTSGGASVVIDARHICRVRRVDVENALSSGRQHHYGYWGFVSSGRNLEGQHCDVVVRLANGAEQTFGFQVRSLPDTELRDLTLAYLANSGFFGNQQLKAIAGIENGLAPEMMRFSRSISQAFCVSPYIESFGNFDRKFKGSIIVCLYGKAEYLFLQAALFSGLPGIEDYEFVYVSNSPELSEQLLREARMCSRTYGVAQTLVLLSGNAGFGAANNVATRYAHSNRYLIVNPDVFPYDREWARKHTDIVASRPAEETALFGAPLFYDDGSLMHGGMHFEVDTIAAIEPGHARKHQSIRVEHYGKGAPAGFAPFQRARMVPAVTGAFMSLDRRWYEKLGGFTEDFVFGHYEDADLCLKSLQLGVPVWMHDLKLWHLEGKGSSRRIEHEGGSIVNRWLFTRNWGDLILEKLIGQSPNLDQFKSAETLQSVIRPAGVTGKRANS